MNEIGTPVALHMFLFIYINLFMLDSEVSLWHLP